MLDAPRSTRFGNRVEDDRLLRGKGRFLSDTRPSDALHVSFVRSPHASARIVSIDVEAATAAAGVVCVLTGDDMVENGAGDVTEHPPQVSADGTSIVLPARPALALQRVTHVGEAVAMVVAETVLEAHAAARLVAVDYVEMPAVTDVEAAVASGAPVVWPDAPDNLALDWAGLADDPAGNATLVADAIDKAAHVAKLRLRHQRLVCSSMEPRGASAIYDPVTANWYLEAGSQGARTVRDALCKVMRIEPERLHVVSGDVGGAFGFKVGAYPEYAALLVAARKCGRPVHWMSSRAEAFLSDTQARDSVTEGELALDSQGRFIALRVRHLANMGAYIATVAAKAQTENFARCLPGCYDIGLVDMQARCAFTHTVPTAPYRGAGRPEANYMLERLVDEAARITGIDRFELRRRNFIRPEAMPYRTPVGTTYDSGEFPAVFERGLTLADVAGFAARRADSERRGRLRGIGVCSSLEHSGATPIEGMWLHFPGEGRVEVRTGVHSMGQGHETVFPRLVAEMLGIDEALVSFAQGDSSWPIQGYSAVGSRSGMHLSHAATRCVSEIVAKGKEAAAEEFGVAAEIVEFADGVFSVPDRNLRMGLFEVDDLLRRRQETDAVLRGLDTVVATETGLTFPNGCHVAEVEIDPATGVLDLVAYACVDDCGTVLDPIIVAGQTHGSIAQGVGQALLEQLVHDREGRPEADGFSGYAIPRAADLPVFREEFHPVPARTNPLGVKGAGEAGTIAAIAAVMNAIGDAIPTEAGRAMQMPATREKIWRACQSMATPYRQDGAVQ